MRFAPVELDEPLNGRASMTFLRHFERCARSGYLLRQSEGVQTDGMVRGSAFHSICERSTRLMIAQGEPMIPPELVKVVVDEVLAEQPVPIAEHDYLREAAYRWATEWAIDPPKVIGCEKLLGLKLGNYTVRGRIDFAEHRPDSQVYVADYKSGKGAPAYDEIARKRADGTMAPKNFQLIVYGLLLAFGRPYSDDGEFMLDVDPPAKGARELLLEFVYPGIENREGRMLRRTMTLNRLELAEYRESLVAILERLERAEREGDWPAVVSTEGCAECPCPEECPIPTALRDHRGTINTLADAAEASEVLDRLSDRAGAMRKEIKAFAKAHGQLEIRYGRNKAWRWGYRESERIEDKEAMLAAVEEAVRSGQPFDPSPYVKLVKSTPFSVETVEESTLEEEAL